MDVIDELKRHLGMEHEDTPIAFARHEEFFKVPRAPSNVLLNTKLPKLPYWRDTLQAYLKKRYPR